MCGCASKGLLTSILLTEMMLFEHVSAMDSGPDEDAGHAAVHHGFADKMLALQFRSANLYFCVFLQLIRDRMWIPGPDVDAQHMAVIKDLLTN